MRKIQKGKNQREVAKSLNISRCAIQALMKKFGSTGTVTDRQKPGRPHKTTAREERKSVMLSKKNPFQTASELNRDWFPSQTVTTRTVRNILRKYGLRGCVAAKVPRLTIKQLKARIRWCRQHEYWPAYRYENVIFSDEFRMELNTNRRQYVRRKLKSRLKERYTTKTVKFGGKSLMIWGCIKHNVDRMLIRCIGNDNSAEYQRVLSEGLLPFYCHDEEFMHDGAPCHRSKPTTECLQRNHMYTVI